MCRSVRWKIKIAGYPGDFGLFVTGAPNEVRTRVSALRGPRPGPLDNGGVQLLQAGHILPRHATLRQQNLPFVSGDEPILPE
jgi:hypothetical protein